MAQDGHSYDPCEGCRKIRDYDYSPCEGCPDKPEKKRCPHCGKELDDHESSCYLTTACVEARGLPDNCLELSTLRMFRENVLMPSAIGRKTLREYEKVAPLIVTAVNASADSEKIWNRVYSDVRIAVSFVRKKEFNKAFEHYKNMTTALKQNYLD